MDKAALEASLDVLDKWLIVFGVLVAIGVAGESVAGFLHWRRSGQLQKVQASEILALEHQVWNARLEFEKYRAPRTLTTEQQARMAANLRTNTQQQYSLSVSQGAEASNLVCILDSVLNAANWKRVPPATAVTVNTECGPVAVNSLSDVHVRFKPGSSTITESHAQLLIEQLNSCHIHAEAEMDPKNILTTNLIVVMVGTKH